MQPSPNSSVWPKGRWTVRYRQTFWFLAADIYRVGLFWNKVSGSVATGQRALGGTLAFRFYSAEEEYDEYNHQEVEYEHDNAVMAIALFGIMTKVPAES